MLFHFLNSIPYVGSMFGHIAIYKVTNLKVFSKGRYFLLKKSLFKNYNERLAWTTKLFSCICDITNCKSRLLKFDWLAGGENACLERTFQNRNPVQVFLYHCISDGNQLFSKNFGCNFYLILHVMSDKAAFVSGALVCVQRYRGNLELSRSNSASRWQIINLHIYICGHK